MNNLIYCTWKFKRGCVINEAIELLKDYKNIDFGYNIYDVLVGYIGQGISKEVVDRMSEEYIETFGLGEYI